MIAAISPTTVLLITAPIALAIVVLVLVLYASQRSRPAVALQLEREAARRDRARRRSEEQRVLEDAGVVAEPEAEPVAVGASTEPGSALAVPEAEAPTVRSVQ